MDNEAQANPAGEPSQMSFRERKAAQLREEREPRQPEQPDTDTSPAPDGLDESDARQPEADTLEESYEDQPKGEETEGALSEAGDPETGGDESEPEHEWTERERELTEAREQAETARSSMEKDYRQKTHKLSESVREVESQAEEVAGAAQYMAALADQGVAQFNGVNWQQLQSNPQEYQKAQQAYAQAVQTQQQRHAELEQISSRAKEIKSKNLDAIAEHSRGVLTHQIPNWGNETYGKIREFAQKNYDYTDKEFDQIVDWRPMKALHDAMQAANFKASSADVVKKRGRKRTKSQQQRNAAQTQNRDTKGRFEAARREAEARPGDRNAFRVMKEAQLRMEREGRR